MVIGLAVAVVLVACAVAFVRICKRQDGTEARRTVRNVDAELRDLTRSRR